MDTTTTPRTDSPLAVPFAPAATDRPYVLVRSIGAGVFAGELLSRTVGGKEVHLTNARRIWYWAGAATLSELATKGTSRPDECRFPAPVDLVVFDAVEIINVTEEARKSIESVPVWTAHDGTDD